jgi:anti-sigma B factor antagonist
VLRIRHETLDDARLFHLDGTVTTVEASFLKREVRNAIAAGVGSIIFDLTEVDLVDSTGLGSLVALHKSALAAGARLHLRGMQSNVRAVVELARLHRVLSLLPDDAPVGSVPAERS